MKAIIMDELIKLVEERRGKNKSGKKLEYDKLLKFRVFIWLLKNIYGVKLHTIANNCAICRQDLYANYYAKIDELINEYGAAIIFMFIEKIQITINSSMLDELYSSSIKGAAEINTVITTHNEIDVYDGRVVFKFSSGEDLRYRMRVQDGVVDVYTYKEGRFIGVFRVKNMCIKIYPKVSKNKQKLPII